MMNLIKPILIKFNGKLACIKEHCKILDISYKAVTNRHYKTGMSYEECLNYYQKIGVKKHMYQFEFNGKLACLSEHCKNLNISYDAVRHRHNKTGESYEKCLEYYQYHGVSEHEHLIEFNGKIANLSEHCRRLGIANGTLYSRHRKTGDSYKKCLEYYQENGVKYKSKYKIKNKKLYKKWQSTKDKCENPNHPSYYLYGKRGIKVCERWQLYENFEADLLDSFLEHIKKYGIEETTIDRWPNNLGDYEPNNVRWATRKEQCNNLTTNHMVTENLNIAQFSKKYNIHPNTVAQRLANGWSVEKIINTPVSHHNTCKYWLPCNNGTKQLKGYCKQNKYPYELIVKYINRYNLKPDEALAKYLENKTNRLS